MLILIVLLLLCIIFQVVNWFSKPKRFWPQFTTFQQKECKNDRECSATQKCFEGECMETLSQTCDPDTGFWTRTADRKLKCECRKPDLITQSIVGGNCKINVGCGLYGEVVSLNPLICKCKNNQFKMNSEGKCIGKTEIDRESERHCSDGYILSSTSVAKQFFHPEYLKQFSHAKCLRIPCTFDALNNNKPLEYAKIIIDSNDLKSWRCLCSPEHGHFGVHLDVSHYIRSIPDSHNACSSIYDEEPADAGPFNFEFYCYFYLKGIAKPVCFLVFHSLPKDGLSAPFKGKKAIAIFDQWPHSYDQEILRNMQVFQRKRYCDDHKFIFESHLPCYDEQNEEIISIKDCASTPNEPFYYDFAAIVNNVYKNHFVCKLPDYLKNKVPPIVVNPWAIDYRIGDYFSHGYQVKKDDFNRKWKIKTAATPYSAYLPLEDGSSQKLMGHKWFRNQRIKHYPIHF